MRTYLRQHAQVLALQAHSLSQEETLQFRHLRLRFFGDRLRIGLQLIGIAFGLVVLLGVGAMVWRAHEAHGLVIEL